jgi:hypothetical protein
MIDLKIPNENWRIITSSDGEPSEHNIWITFTIDIDSDLLAWLQDNAPGHVITRYMWQQPVVTFADENHALHFKLAWL